LTDIVTLDGHDAVYRLIKLDLVAGSVAVGINDDTPSTFGQHPALAGMRVPERYDAQLWDGAMLGGTHWNLSSNLPLFDLIA
jgi:hypothetical protein